MTGTNSENGDRPLISHDKRVPRLKHGFDSRRGHQHLPKWRNSAVFRFLRTLYPSLYTKDVHKVIRMAAPFKDPRTGILYFRRVIPAALRPFFDGGASEYKRTLDTRDPNEARQRYHPHAVVYEQKLAAARRSPLAARGPATTSARHAQWSTTFSTDNRTRIFAAWRRSSPRSNSGIRPCQRPDRRCARRSLRLRDFAKPR